MSANPKLYTPVQDFFVLEATSERKHEYLDGEIRAMSGGTVNHGAIAINAATSIRYALRGSNCRVFSSDVLIKISESRYVYPDFSVTCGDRIVERNGLALLNPILVAEVTSRSSVDYDRGEKRDYYLSVPSVQYYLVIDQNEVSVELNTRIEIGWVMDQFSSADDAVPLPLLNSSLSLSDVYDGIEFQVDQP